MDTMKIKQAADKVDAERKRLAVLKEERALLNCSGHPSEISVTVGTTRRVLVARSGYDTGYTSKLIRGREMIALGVIKAFEGWIAEAESDVKNAESALSALVPANAGKGASP